MFCCKYTAVFFRGIFCKDVIFAACSIDFVIDTRKSLISPRSDELTQHAKLLGHMLFRSKIIDKLYSSQMVVTIFHKIHNRK